MTGPMGWRGGCLWTARMEGRVSGPLGLRDGCLDRWDGGTGASGPLGRRDGCLLNRARSGNTCLLDRWTQVRREECRREYHTLPRNVCRADRGAGRLEGVNPFDDAVHLSATIRPSSGYHVS